MIACFWELKLPKLKPCLIFSDQERAVRNAFQMLRFNEKDILRGDNWLHWPLKNVLCCLLDNGVQCHKSGLQR
jgi:hypothetical protein